MNYTIMYMNKLRVLKKLDTLFYTVSFVSFFPDHNAQPPKFIMIIYLKKKK